jgi:uncharacterized metal-binding protein YceD (DUF177 family)
MGLQNGEHEFLFDINTSFFEAFESELKVNKTFSVKLYLDKRHDMSDAVFTFSGELGVNCHRCLSPFSIPIDGSFVLRIKYGEVDDNEDEVLFISEETSMVNFAQIIYEYLVLALPMVIVHEDIDDCDQDIINKMNSTSEELKSNPIWKGLEDLDLS